MTDEQQQEEQQGFKAPPRSRTSTDGRGPAPAGAAKFEGFDD
jgi:hypothetical protein